ncbi:MAG TPA: CPBP family glutamic-type intramembrane protease [Blastocatellia bacterium]|nr:CPBP family glutamic-type intramembrane protease [Blastocatellia bacterium]
MQLETLIERNKPEWEVTAFVFFLMSYIWGWQGAFRGSLLVVIGGGLLFIAVSNFVHRDKARALGLRVDNLPQSLLEVGAVTIVILLVVAGSGWLLGTLREPEWWKLRAVYWHYFWAFVQQYALQAFVLTRLREVYPDENRAALSAAGWFAFLHLPNPPLTVMTFVMGYVWCRLFQRYPNLFTLALSHTILAIVTSHSFPRVWMHSMKVGPGYFNF